MLHRERLERASNRKEQQRKVSGGESGVVYGGGRGLRMKIDVSCFFSDGSQGGQKKWTICARVESGSE